MEIAEQHAPGPHPRCVSQNETTRFLWLGVANLTLFLSLTFRQGGPPLRSDDPDTPGNRKREINMGFVGQRNPVAGSYEVPNNGINYGLGHRIQLKYEVPLSIQEMRGGDAHVAAGLENSLLGLKYRFYAHPTKTQTRYAAGERESTVGLLVYSQPHVEQSHPFGGSRNCGARPAISPSAGSKREDRSNSHQRGSEVLVHDQGCPAFMDTWCHLWS